MIMQRTTRKTKMVLRWRRYWVRGAYLEDGGEAGLEDLACLHGLEFGVPEPLFGDHAVEGDEPEVGSVESEQGVASDEPDEEFVVLFAYVAFDPDAVVVELGHAVVRDRRVFGPCGPMSTHPTS